MPDKLKETIQKLGETLSDSPELQDKMIAYGSGLADGKALQEAKVKELEAKLAKLQKETA